MQHDTAWKYPGPLLTDTLWRLRRYNRPRSYAGATYVSLSITYRCVDAGLHGGFSQMGVATSLRGHRGEASHGLVTVVQSVVPHWHSDSLKQCDPLNQIIYSITPYRE